MRGHRDSGDRRAFVDGTVHLISHAKTTLAQFPPCRPRETLLLDLRIDVFKLKYRRSTKTRKRWRHENGWETRLCLNMKLPNSKSTKLFYQRFLYSGKSIMQ